MGLSRMEHLHRMIEMFPERVEEARQIPRNSWTDETEEAYLVRPMKCWEIARDYSKTLDYEVNSTFIFNLEQELLRRLDKEN